jgi:putative ABC transport system permease protein
MALGATRTDVIRMVLGEALSTVCAGLLIGVPVASGSKRRAASLIHDLPVSGAAPVMSGAAAMVAVTIFAAYRPSRRASRVNPLVAPRHE